MSNEPTKEAIFALDDLPMEAVDIPEWNCTVWVRGLKVEETDSFHSEAMSDNGSANVKGLRARMVAMCTCDSTGKRIFDDADAERLQQKSDLAIQRIWLTALRLNGMSRDFVEKYTKNLNESPS